MLASYAHLRTIGSCYWATRFAAFVRRTKQQKMLAEHAVYAVPEDSTPAVRM
jgi:hypothetical protein